MIRAQLLYREVEPLAALTFERLNLEFKEIHALPSAKEAAAQPLLF